MKNIWLILIGVGIVVIFGCIEIKYPPPKPRATSFKIESISVTPLAKYHDGDFTEVLVLVSIQDGNFRKTNFGESHLVDSSGKLNPAIGNFTINARLATLDKSDQAYFSYRFPPISQIPKEIGSIYFKTDISFDDLPTQPINVLIRE